MKGYITIELENNSEFVIVDMIEYYKKKYFLVVSVIEEETKIGDKFQACIYDEQKNSLKEITSQEEYNFVFSIFESRLEKQNKINEMLKNMIKMKIVGIEGYNYILETVTGHKLEKNIEFYIKNNPPINSYIYMSKNIINEVNIFQYGKIYDLNRITEDEIIKIEIGETEYFLQRYYG